MARKKKLRKLQQALRQLQAQSAAASAPPQPVPTAEQSPRQIVERLVRMSMIKAETFSGPIPPPQLLEQYNKLVPGFAERFMVMAEKQLDHRHVIEAEVIKTRTRNERVGMNYAFALAILFGAGAFYLLVNGHGAAGISIIVGEIIALAGVFVTAKIIQGKENRDKLDTLMGRSEDASPDVTKD